MELKENFINFSVGLTELDDLLIVLLTTALMQCLLNLVEFSLESCNHRAVKASINISSSLSYFIYVG